MVLEDDAALGTRTRDLAAGAEQDAGGRLEQPGDQIEQRRLAAAGVADQRDELALRDREIDVAQRDERTALGLERHADVLDVDEFARWPRIGVGAGNAVGVGHDPLRHA